MKFSVDINLFARSSRMRVGARIQAYAYAYTGVCAYVCADVCMCM